MENDIIKRGYMAALKSSKEIIGLPYPNNEDDIRDCNCGVWGKDECEPVEVVIMKATDYDTLTTQAELGRECARALEKARGQLLLYVPAGSIDSVSDDCLEYKQLLARAKEQGVIE